MTAAEQVDVEAGSMFPNLQPARQIRPILDLRVDTSRLEQPAVTREFPNFGNIAGLIAHQVLAKHAACIVRINTDDVREDVPYGVRHFHREINQLESARHQRALWHERSARDDLWLAGLYQLVNRQEDAAALLDEIVAQLEVEYSGGVRHWETLYQLSEAYARQGRDDEALAMLRKSYDYHGLMPCSALESGLYLEIAAASPWSRFAEDSRYQSLCRRIDDDRIRQADRIRAMLAQYNVDELLAPLMAMAQKPGDE